MQKRKLELSIVCATHNNSSNLIKTIDSIYKNSILPSEIVICTTDIADKNNFDTNIVKDLNINFIESKRKSQTHQRELAIKKSSNDIIIQIDDDIYFYHDSLEQLYNYYIKNKNNKIIVSSFLIYEDGNHVSYRFNNYFKFKIIKLIYFLLTGKLKLSDMSLTLSGRIIPKLDLKKINENKYEWLSSLIIYKKQSYFDATHLDVDGKGYYEDVFFTYSLMLKGYDLKIARNSVAKIEKKKITGLLTYFKIIPIQFKFVKKFKKSIILLILDFIIFMFIHLLISIFKIFKK